MYNCLIIIICIAMKIDHVMNNFSTLAVPSILCTVFGMSTLVIGILQPSLYSELSRCSLDDLTSQQQRDMFQCFIKCQQNPCCRTVNVTGTCQQFYTLSQNADFVKNVGIWKENIFLYDFENSSFIVCWKQHFGSLIFNFRLLQTCVLAIQKEWEVIGVLLSLVNLLMLEVVDG